MNKKRDVKVVAINAMIACVYAVLTILCSGLSYEMCIRDRYLQGVLSIGYKEAIGYGIAFHKKRCKITMIK